MSDDLNTEIKIGADASGVEAGVGRAKRSLKDLGDSAQKAGKDAGAGMAAVGAGGDKAAKDVERATKNIQGQLQRAIASFEAGEKGSRKFYESIARQRGVDVNTLKPLLDQLDAYKAKTEAASQASAKASTSFTGLGAAAGLAARAVAAIGISASVGEFIKMADASTNVASRLGLVTSSAAELASVQARLFGIAQSSRVSFTDLVGTYAQVARSTKDLGVSQTALLGVIQTISQAVTISGGSAASAQAALVQLSQGFAAGALRGEELNSIMEQTPRLAQAIADGMGVSVGKLRELGQAGELTAEKVLGALEKSAASVAAEFGKMAVTVEQASTNAANSVLRLVGAFDRLLGVTSAVGGAIQTISNGLDFLSSDVEKLGNQGPLRDAAREVINLNAAAERLRTGMASGVLGPNAQGELDRINARLAEAKQRFRELDQQLSGGKDPRDQSGFTGRGVSYANEAARQAKLREDANAFRLNQAGVPASYLKDMAELIRLNQAGVIVGKEYTDALAKQQDLLLKKTTTVRGSAAAANAEQNAYESLISSINAKIEADKLEMAGGSALTESQRIRIKLDQDLAAGRVKLSAQNERAVRLALEELKASEASALAAKTLAKANLDAAASREKYLTSLSTGLDKIQADIAAQIEATERMGLSKEAIAELDAAKLEMLATDLELQAVKALDRNLDQQTYDALKKQAAAYRELGIAKKGGAAKEAALDLEKANADAAKKAQEDWERASEQINNTLTDALMRGFESGKDFAKNMRDTVVNMFKTMVLRPVISAIVNPISQGITGMMGLSGAAQAGQGMSAIGAAGNLFSAGSALGGLGAVGGALSGFTTAATASIQSLVGMSGTVAQMTTSLAAAGHTAASGVSAGVQAFQAIPGWGWAIAGIAALAAIFSKKATPHAGGASTYSEAGGLVSSADIYRSSGLADTRTYNAEISTALTGNVAKAIGDTLNATAKAFGQTAGYEITTAFADDTSKDGAWGSLIIKQMGDAVLDWRDTQTSKWAPKEFADGEAGSKEYLAAVAKSARDALVTAIGEVDWATDMLTALGDSPTLEGLAQTVQQINAAQAAFDALGKNIVGFGALTDGAISQLVKAAGSIDGLVSAASAYYDNFYSEAEKTAAVTRSVSDALAQVGLAMPATRDEFRALVESQLSMGEAGAEAVAALLGVSGAFASVVPAAANATASLQAQAEAMEGLQIKLLRAQGNELAAVAIERQKELTALQAFGPAAVAMQQQIYGIMDAMSALESGAAAYFAGVDRQQAADDYTGQGGDALSKFFGMAADASAGAAARAAQASADAASTAAASWRSAAQSIQAAIDGLRAGTTDAMDPAARYALTKATLDAYTVSALGGDADAASKLAGAADDFLRASESGSTTQAQYLRDRVLAEAKLASVMESSEAQASVQDTIAASAGAAVTQLEAMNANLTGFASTLYELLSTQYQGADRGTADGVASTFGQMQADFDAYFNDFKTGSTYTDAAFNGGSFTRLSGDMAAYTDADGVISYLRATESILDIAKRIPELRQAWEQQYGLKLPGYAVGTSYVPVTGPALLHEGEAVIPKAFNPWAGGGQGNGEMLAELRALRQTNERLEARLASIEESNRDMATLLDNVTEGGNAMRSEVMA